MVIYMWGVKIVELGESWIKDLMPRSYLFQLQIPKYTLKNMIKYKIVSIKYDIQNGTKYKSYIEPTKYIMFSAKKNYNNNNNNNKHF